MSKKDIKTLFISFTVDLRLLFIPFIVIIKILLLFVTLIVVKTTTLFVPCRLRPLLTPFIRYFAQQTTLSSKVVNNVKNLLMLFWKKRCLLPISVKRNFYIQNVRPKII